MESIRYYKAMLSEKGTNREMNEDSSFLEIIKQGRNFGFLAGVADGVGKTDAGEIASGYVKESFEKWIKENGSSLFEKSSSDVKKMIDGVISRTQALLVYRANESGKTYGTTLTMILVLNTRYIVCQIGDSRCYLYGKRTGIKQLTHDQTKYELCMEKGIEIPEGDIEHSKAVLTQCIGKGKVNPIYSEGILPDEYQILLATDGFYHKLQDEELSELFEKTNVGNVKLKKCVELVRGRGETDDITAVFVRKVYE